MSNSDLLLTCPACDYTYPTRLSEDGGCPNCTTPDEGWCSTGERQITSLFPLW